MLLDAWIGCWFVCCIHTLGLRPYVHAVLRFPCHAVFRTYVALIKIQVINDCRRTVPTVRTTSLSVESQDAENKRWLTSSPTHSRKSIFFPTVRFLFMSLLIPSLLNFHHSPQKHFILLVTSSTTFHKYRLLSK